MRTVTVRGWSDDSVVVRGERYSDEFYTSNGLLHVGNATFTVEFTRAGTWKIVPIQVSREYTIEVVPAPRDYDEEIHDKNYSDVVTITGPFEYSDISVDI